MQKCVTKDDVEATVLEIFVDYLMKSMDSFITNRGSDMSDEHVEYLDHMRFKIIPKAKSAYSLHKELTEYLVHDMPYHEFRFLRFLTIQALRNSVWDILVDPNFSAQKLLGEEVFECRQLMGQQHELQQRLTHAENQISDLQRLLNLEMEKNKCLSGSLQEIVGENAETLAANKKLVAENQRLHSACEKKDAEIEQLKQQLAELKEVAPVLHAPAPCL